MDTKDIANRLVELCRQGQFETAITELYGNDIVSVEPEGAPVKEVSGIAAVIEKGQNFNAMVEEFHGMEVSDPVIADSFFSCSMKMDVTFKGASRSTMEEVCLYQVKDGKIVREEFFFTPMQQG